MISGGPTLDLVSSRRNRFDNVPYDYSVPNTIGSRAFNSYDALKNLQRTIHMNQLLNLGLNPNYLK